MNFLLHKKNPLVLPPDFDEYASMPQACLKDKKIKIMILKKKLKTQNDNDFSEYFKRLKKMTNSNTSQSDK